MSYALATDFIKKPKTPKKQATSTASVPAPEEGNQNDTDPSIVTFDLLADFQEDDDISNEEILKC